MIGQCPRCGIGEAIITEIFRIHKCSNKDCGLLVRFWKEWAELKRDSEAMKRLREVLSQMMHAAKYAHHEICLARDRREIRGGWWDKVCQQLMDAFTQTDAIIAARDAARAKETK